MVKRTVRKIVRIDEDKCDGCGLCVPSCAEGAIEIIDGKARLAADNLCDGLGNCLGKCPQDAITIEERPAEPFDEAAVRARGQQESARAEVRAARGGGCPGAALRRLRTRRPSEEAPRPPGVPAAQSELTHWPVQLALVPVSGPIWTDADVLLAADCVAFAMPDFHQRLLAGKTVAVACPKLDDAEPYVEKLTAIFAGNAIRSVTVAHMEVPCCGGILHAARAALQQAGRTDIELHDVTVAIDGNVQERREDRARSNNEDEKGQADEHVLLPM